MLVTKSVQLTLSTRQCRVFRLAEDVQYVQYNYVECSVDRLDQVDYKRFYSNRLIFYLPVLSQFDSL